MSESRLLIYKYCALDINGQRIEGELTARSRQEVVDTLHERNYRPMSIEEKVKTVKEIGDIEILPQKVKTKDLSLLCRQLATMLKAGMPLDRAMKLMIKQTNHKMLKRTLEEVSIGINQGVPLSGVMKAHKAVFPKMLINMTEAGEATGGLDLALLRMAEHFEKQNKLNNKVKGAMMYPILLFVLTMVVFIGLMVFVIPIFAKLFADSGTEMPVITQVLINLSAVMISYWYLLIVGIIAVVFGIRAFLSWKKGRYWFDMMKLKLPIVRKPMQQLVTARFTRTLSTLLSSGIQLVSALNFAAETVNNVVIEEAVVKAAEDIKTGASLSTQLKKIEYFPIMMTSMVGIGEEAGELDEMLEKTAAYYDEEADNAMTKLTSLLEPVAIIFIGIVVGVVVIAMYLPLFKSYSALS